MSRSTSIIIGLALVLTFSAFANRKFNSSVANGKKYSLQPSSQILRHTEKLQPPVHATLTNSLGRPLEFNETFTLQATVGLEKKYFVLNYQWVLPKGVVLSGGTPMSGQLYNVSPDSPPELRGEFINNSHDNERVFLKIWADNKTEKLAASAQFNTLRQEEINQGKRALLERQNEYLADHPELLKTFK